MMTHIQETILARHEEVVEASFIELVVAASECSEDENEIFDLVDGLLGSGRVRLLPEMETEEDTGSRLYPVYGDRLLVDPQSSDSSLTSSPMA